MMRIASLAVLLVLLMSAGPVSARDIQPTDAGAPLYDPKNQRDPFVALVQDGRIVGAPKTLGGGDPSELNLYGILWDAGGSSIALINDVEAKVGDQVGGYRVEEIRKDAVIVSNGDQRVELQIKF